MALPFIPIKIDDYFSDTAHLTTEQHGAYLLLIFNYWQSEKPLNNKGGRLRHVAKLSAEKWTEIEPILTEFFEVENDLWTHGRIEFDLQKALSKSKMNSYAGKKSARRRAELKDVEQMLNTRSTPVEQMLNHTDTEANAENTKIMVIKDDPINDPDFKVFWMAYPKKVKKAPAAKSYLKALKKATSDEIFAGLVRYQRTCGDDPKFIANPDSWLNQERWNDNPQVVVEGSSKKAPSQSSARFGVSENAPVVPKFTIEDVLAPTRPLKSWRELVEESE